MQTFTTTWKLSTGKSSAKCEVNFEVQRKLDNMEKKIMWQKFKTSNKRKERKNEQFEEIILHFDSTRWYPSELATRLKYYINIPIE